MTRNVLAQPAARRRPPPAGSRFVAAFAAMVGCRHFEGCSPNVAHVWDERRVRSASGLRWSARLRVC